MATIGDKKLLNPETNIISISNKRDWRFYVYLAKIFLKKFDSVELKALGNSADICVQVSESMAR